MTQKDCSEVIHQIFVFIDNELDQASCGEIQQHLDECGPCLAKYDLERTVKALVARSCSEHAPEDLREKVLLRIRQVQVTLHGSTGAEAPGPLDSTTGL
jgi:mycothiol system anti-sigma-R factor